MLDVSLKVSSNFIMSWYNTSYTISNCTLLFLLFFLVQTNFIAESDKFQPVLPSGFLSCQNVLVSADSVGLLYWSCWIIPFNYLLFSWLMYCVHNYFLLGFLDHEVGASFDNLVEITCNPQSFLSWAYVEDCLISPLANLCSCYSISVHCSPSSIDQIFVFSLCWISKSLMKYQIKTRPKFGPPPGWFMIVGIAFLLIP